MISNYTANTFLRTLVGKASSLSVASTAYLALSSTEPQADGTGVTEPEGMGYARKLIGNYNQSATQLMGEPSNGNITNVSEIHFDEATGAWGELSYACIFDAPTGGRLIAWGVLGHPSSDTANPGWVPEPISPTANTVAIIKAGNLNISIE